MTAFQRWRVSLAVDEYGQTAPMALGGCPVTILCKLQGVRAELIKHGLAVDVEGGHQQTRREATLPRTKVQGF
jgi:hypothetical protein